MPNKFLSVLKQKGYLTMSWNLPWYKDKPEFACIRPWQDMVAKHEHWGREISEEFNEI